MSLIGFCQKIPQKWNITILNIHCCGIYSSAKGSNKVLNLNCLKAWRYWQAFCCDHVIVVFTTWGWIMNRWTMDQGSSCHEVMGTFLQPLLTSNWKLSWCLALILPKITNGFETAVFFLSSIIIYQILRLFWPKTKNGKM